jgi:hypothetical protein
MKIVIYITRNYGVDVAYPVCDKAFQFAAIAGTTTLTPRVLGYIRKLGYEMEVQPNDLGRFSPT